MMTELYHQNRDLCTTELFDLYLMFYTPLVLLALLLHLFQLLKLRQFPLYFVYYHLHSALDY